MPGIAGMISRQPAGACQNLVAGMVDSMVHEPFYCSGTQAFPEQGIYAGWVAHEGSLSANQVFWNEQRNVALLFSGECFMDSDTRAALAAKGHTVDSTPGGWLVHLYEELGDDFFAALNGLFSGLLIDRRQNKAFLFNDRYGIERIYWHATKDATYFASEAKALLRVLPELRAFDEAGVRQFLTFGCTLDWKTLFHGVQLAPGGTLWVIEEGVFRKTQYFTPAQWESQPPLTEEEFQQRFSETFKRILPRYFQTSSGVGISLTGGLDTRMIMACLPAQEVPPVCYTFAGENARMLDLSVARKVAQTCGLRHEPLRIGAGFFSRFGDLADRTIYASDGCFGVLGAHEIYLNAQARSHSPVRLTGNFGSEVLRSVSTFKPLGLSADLFDTEFLHADTVSSHATTDRACHPVSFAAFHEIPWNLFGSLTAGRSQVTFRTPYLDNELVELAFRAPQGVRTSSASAVRFVSETCPRLAAIPTDRGLGGNGIAPRRRLRRLYADVTFKLDYMCSEGLPFGLSALDSYYQQCNALLGIQGLHKFLTYRNWLQSELAVFAEDRLTEAAKAELPFINRRTVGLLALEHVTRRKNRTREIAAVLTLEAVQRLFFQERFHEVSTEESAFCGIESGSSDDRGDKPSLRAPAHSAKL